MIGSLIACFVIPLIIWLVIFVKGKGERGGIFVLFLLGALFYAGMQWGVKQHGLAYLFEKANLYSFMINHYISYLLLVALCGAILAIIPEIITVLGIFRRKITFKQALSMGLGYTICETGFLLVYPFVATLIPVLKNEATKLSTSSSEMVLSGFERLLLTVIGTGLIVMFIYDVEQKSTIKGSIAKVICQTLAAFIPGFLIAFSTEDFLEVFDRSTTLIMSYVILSAAAFACFILIDSLKWKMYEK